jgi:predicted MFS family arabinose efflux permease
VTSAVIRVMLSRFGLRKTMLIKTGVDAIVLGAAYLLIRERRKPSTTIVWYDKKFLTDPTFWSITACMCLSNFGFPAPFFYLPTFAKQKVPNLTELVSTQHGGVLVC